MSKRKSTKHCCFVLFCGAPRALLSERCAAGGHHRPSGVHGRIYHSPFPVSSLPQSRLALQGNKKKTLCDLSRSVFGFWCLKYRVFCYFFQSENCNNFCLRIFLFCKVIQSPFLIFVKIKSHASWSIFCTFLFVLCRFYFWISITSATILQ